MPFSSAPNILMIQADQMTAFALGCYGQRAAQTPNLDRLAAEGVQFLNAYCNSPLCGPSRASMVTGRMPSAIDSFDNANELPASATTFMHVLRHAGYACWLSGKMHFVGPDQLHGFHGRTNTDIYPSSFQWTPDWRRGAYGNAGTSVHFLHQSGVCDWGLQLDYDEETLALGLRQMRDLVRRRARTGQPFFLCVSFTHPHDPYFIAPEYWSRIRESDVAPPAVPAMPLEAMHPYDRWLQIHHEIDRYPPSEQTILAARRAYLAMASYIDDKVGALLEETRRLGIERDTIVLFTSDHGDMQGEHGMWFKRTYFEGSMRVPLLFHGAGSIGGGRRIASPVSLVDLFPTLADLAGAPGDWPGAEALDGSSLAPFLAGDRDSWDRPAICEYCGEGVTAPMRMARQGDWKSVDVAGEAPLLFDLASDPNETRNLAQSPEAQALQARLRQAALNGWDGEAMRRRILADQQRRLFLYSAQLQGGAPAWDYQPYVDASRQYVREGFSTQETKRRERWPHVPDSV
ncbi:MAG: Choline-sulfatase [candidate division BRC1 bacterium ADurb.BinA364]|nr:MAG: Choline-sulfatase [candidate division BRC1 bacterium ADurb.BinA364]